MDGERYTMLALIKSKRQPLYQIQTFPTSKQGKLSGTEALHNDKALIPQEDIILNVCAPNNIVKISEAKTELQGETDENTILAGDSHIPASDGNGQIQQADNQ